jgi:hypothetical protein
MVGDTMDIVPAINIWKTIDVFLFIIESNK